MIKSAERPQTLMEAVRYFDIDTAEAYLASVKWPSGEAICPECGSLNIGRINSRRAFQCREKGCRKQFSTRLGTIAEQSPLGLDKFEK